MPDIKCSTGRIKYTKAEAKQKAKEMKCMRKVKCKKCGCWHLIH